MTGFPGSPRLVKGGLVLLDPASSAVLRVISLQYNPDTLTRSLQVQAVSEGGDRSEALRLIAPPTETIKLDAEIDATDQLEFPDQNSAATQAGLLPQLAALEMLVYPGSDKLIANNKLAASGSMEIIPDESALTLFVWSKSRILPVRITEFSITEEAFDPALNPTRAKVSLGMRVLTPYDLGFDNKGGSLFLAYLRSKERFANMSPASTLGTLGVGGIL